jgi:hypothetical protein
MTLFAGMATLVPTPENIVLGSRAFCRVAEDPAPFRAPYKGHPCIVLDIDLERHSLSPYLCRLQVLSLI